MWSVVGGLTTRNLVGGRFLSQPLVGSFSDRCSVVGYFLGKWSVVGVTWSVVCGLWSVAGRWAVVLYYAD